jgi:hypothetical protein
MIDFDREAIIAKTQAVVEATHKEGAKFDEVKTAQTELVTLLKETFGRSRLEQFKTDYPDAVMNFDDITTIPWVKKHIDENVLSKSNRQERFEALSAMFLVKEGALDGNHQDSPHTNVKVLADDIVPNLANALAEAYPEQLVDYNSGAIGLKTGVKSENLHPSLGALVATLQHLNNVFQPILPETGNYSPLLSVIAEEEIANFTEAQKLSYKMVQARLKGKSSEGQAEMANVTEQMNNLLRTQLKALNEGKSVVIAEAAEAVDSVLETLIQGIPETATYPSKQGVLPISTLGELAYVKKGMHTNNMLKSFSGQVEEKVRIDLGVTDLSQQEKIGRIINAVFNLKNGEAIDPLLEDLTNKPEIVDYVQNTIKQLSDPAYRLEEVKTIIIGLGQLIKEGLPTSIAE